MLRFYKIISYVFHPLLFSSIGTFLFLFLSPQYFVKQQISIILLVIFIGTYIIPILLLAFLKRFQMISSFHLTTIEERKFPVLFFILLSFMIGKMLLNIRIVDLLAYSFFGTAFALTTTYLVFKKNIKTSLHTLGAGGITAFLIIMSYEYQQNFNLIIAISFTLSGIIAVSRLKSNAHVAKEVYFGFLIGFISQWLGSFFYWL